ncbi:MAG: hypothetical protein IPO21_09110 [Bacteroidales bacterium]|nr:hypothetical protein [Bacteroidales bacterium]
MRNIYVVKFRKFTDKIYCSFVMGEFLLFIKPKMLHGLREYFTGSKLTA